MRAAGSCDRHRHAGHPDPRRQREAVDQVGDRSISALRDSGCTIQGRGAKAVALRTGGSVRMLDSVVCRYEHFLTEWYARWLAAIGFDNATASDLDSPLHVHRKVWEWCAIAQALYERSMLKPGSTACGFAVGEEPLTSMFASFGVQVLATDAPDEG